MKLLFCPVCQDVKKLLERRRRVCICGESWGQYTDDLNAVLGGKALPLGIDNMTFVDAYHHIPEHGQGARFQAFFIEKKCPTVSYEEDS